MRLVSSLFVAAALLAGPALAQDAPAAPAAEPAPAAPAAIELPPIENISPTADRDFWCAMAYTLTARAADVSGDKPAAMAEAEKSQILFASIVTAMKKANMQEPQFNLLTAQYTARVLNPFSRDEGGYTKDVCEAAVPEAKAFVEANPAAPAPAAPAPDAPAAPAADAPAAPAAQ
ncbi:hypothetical protein [Devosia sp.]|jgi:pyruvate dehydrogenase E2 component (dihydrolipoamide acetyltransferase)|uniref:hypothetical protein n=1 Tax=Devosia sp. TaxID=1871048 RepID=UPI0037BF2729